MRCQLRGGTTTPTSLDSVFLSDDDLVVTETWKASVSQSTNMRLPAGHATVVATGQLGHNMAHMHSPEELPQEGANSADDSGNASVVTAQQRSQVCRNRGCATTVRRWLHAVSYFCGFGPSRVQTSSNTPGAGTRLGR